MVVVPEETIVQILLNVDFLEIVKCRAVSRHWNLSISSSAALQYIVWLGIHGKEDGDPDFTPRSSLDRLQALLQQESAWGQMIPRRVDFPETARDSFEQQLNNGGLVRLCMNLDPVLLQQGQSAIVFMSLRLPSMVLPQSFNLQPEVSFIQGVGHWHHSWDFHRNGVHILTTNNQIALDLSEPVIRLRSTTIPDDPNPFARITDIYASDLQITRPSNDGPATTAYRVDRTDISGHLLLLEISAQEEIDPGSRSVIIIIWDWIAGKIMARLGFRTPSDTSHKAYSGHLSSSTTLAVVQYSPFAHPCVIIKVYDLPCSLESSEEALMPALRRTFLLPAMHDVDFLNFTFSIAKPDETPKWPSSRLSQTAGTTAPAPLKPFRPAEQWGLCQLEVETRRHSWHFLFPRSALLRDYGNDMVAWEDWGASEAACFCSGIGWATKPLQALSGSRLACVRWMAEPRNSETAQGESVAQPLRVLEIIDFNPIRARRSARPESWPRELTVNQESSELVHHEHGNGIGLWATKFPDDVPFLQWPIPVGLPYTIKRLEKPEWQAQGQQINQVLMDSEHVVLIKRDLQLDRDLAEVMTF
ncbi:hypothetical protein DL93DRAFT_2091081 [Clavulina sp. PMI_390]|nr:hypothetical protein DL93DRAFT_2091081 [Clavulina sp. PMI_390]